MVAKKNSFQFYRLLPSLLQLKVSLNYVIKISIDLFTILRLFCDFYCNSDLFIITLGNIHTRACERENMIHGPSLVAAENNEVVSNQQCSTD